ncbi:MAG: acetylxylan esterase [Bacteroidota bacterium]|nr:acetylxylan esterase [Bacteroidota bacterium]
MLFFIFPLHAQPEQEFIDLFNYKRSTPFSFQIKETERHRNSFVHIININNDKLQKIEAYLIEPKSDGKFPVVIFQHGGNADKRYFLKEAKELSKKGVICLLVEAAWLRTIYINNILWASTSQYYRQGIIDIQRSIDFLYSKENVDTSRIAFAGHSYGAQIGGILSGIEPRIKAFVLMSGTSNLTELLKQTDHPHIKQLRDSIQNDFDNWLEQMEPLNPIHYIKYSTAPIFLQFATNDEYDIDEVEAKNYVAAAKHVTEHVKFYMADHKLENKKAEEDRIQWLIKKLEPVAGIKSSIKP